MKTLFFFLFLGLVGNVGNLVAELVEERWYAFIQVLFWIPQIYTAIYVCKWCGQDNFYVRYKISQGFKYIFIFGIFTNVILLIVAVALLSVDDSEFYDGPEADKTAIITSVAITYALFIAVYGFIGWYWWTVSKRWANLLSGDGSMPQGMMGMGMMGMNNMGNMGNMGQKMGKNM